MIVDVPHVAKAARGRGPRTKKQRRIQLERASEREQRLREVDPRPRKENDE